MNMLHHMLHHYRAYANNYLPDYEILRGMLLVSDSLTLLVSGIFYYNISANDYLLKRMFVLVISC
jgi:hypothetical protein